MEKKPKIIVENLQLFYGKKQALSNINLTINERINKYIKIFNNAFLKAGVHGFITFQDYRILLL